MTHAPFTLHDPVLQTLADVLTDFEDVRIRSQNRTAALVRVHADTDEPTPAQVAHAEADMADSADYKTLIVLVDGVKKLENTATARLEKVMKEHPLGAWVAGVRGVGEKGIARFLGVVGDPYIRPELTRPDGTVEPSRDRKMSELWAYCGLHTLPVGHSTPEDQRYVSDGERVSSFSSEVRVAAARRRGQHANWSGEARKRLWTISEAVIKSLSAPCVKPDPDDERVRWATHVEGCTCSPYRVIYDASRVRYADAQHDAECVRCGPSGKPALPGSLLSNAHKKGRAQRKVMKELLRDLWLEARRLHLEARGETA
ncbi:MAG TPA: hypothetical protein VK631_14860 [Solirubrobacteraceae bacterium]|nr:hypothetical protein [Solirubrobacteraceae bacterium]